MSGCSCLGLGLQGLGLGAGLVTGLGLMQLRGLLLIYPLLLSILTKMLEDGRASGLLEVLDFLNWGYVGASDSRFRV